MSADLRRDDVDQEDDLALLHRAVDDLACEPHAIVDR
jgi:hypothetical protein